MRVSGFGFRPGVLALACLLLAGCQVRPGAVATPASARPQPEARQGREEPGFDVLMAHLGFDRGLARSATLVRYGHTQWFSAGERVSADAIRHGFMIRKESGKTLLSLGLANQPLSDSLLVQSVSLADFVRRGLAKRPSGRWPGPRFGSSYGHVPEPAADFTRLRILAYVCRLRGRDDLAVDVLAHGQRRVNAESHLQQMSLDQAVRHDLARREWGRILGRLCPRGLPNLVPRVPATWDQCGADLQRFLRLFPHDGLVAKARDWLGRLAVMRLAPWPTDTHTERLVARLRDQPWHFESPGPATHSPAALQLIGQGPATVPTLVRAMLRTDLSRTVATMKEAPAVVHHYLLRSQVAAVLREITNLDIASMPVERATIALRAWCARRGLDL